MTVVSFLDLDGKRCVACADERVTYGGIRTFDIYTKLSRLGRSSVTGFSGNGSYGREIVDLAGERIGDQADFPDVAKTLKDAYKTVKKEKMTDTLLQRFFISPEDVKSLSPESEIAKEILGQLRSGDLFEVTFALAGYDEHRKHITLCIVGYPGHTNLQQKYSVIGSGSDRAHLSIGDSLQRMDTDKRQKIEPYEGVRILMEATRSAWRNEGVGGSTQVMLIGDGETSELGRRESNMLNNALYCERRGTLDSEDVTHLFQRIVNDRASVKELIKQLTGKVGQDAMNRMFWAESLHV